jgi:hypothetical protein
MHREIKNPRWMNDRKTTIACEFHYSDGRIGQAAVTNTEEGNPDWIEIIETFGVEELDRATEEYNERVRVRKETEEQRRKEQFETAKNEMLFNAKLESFMIDEVKNSKNAAMKSRIRKAKSITEVIAFTSALLMSELSPAKEKKSGKQKKPE